MKRLGVLAVTFLVILGVVECTLATFFEPVGRKPVEDVAWMVQDPIAGWMNRPNFRHPDHATLQINSLGLRGPEVAVPKRPGVLRIVCIGDSATFGIQGRYPDMYLGNYAEVLAALLAERGVTDVEVINAGVIGYSSSHGLRFLATRALDLEPDIVSVRFGFNDHAFSWNTPLRQTESRNPILRELLYQTHELQLVRLGLNAYQSNPSFHPPIFSLAWVNPEEFEYNLRRMAEISRDRGIRLLFIDYPIRPLDRGMGEVDHEMLKLWGDDTLAAFHEKHYQYQDIVAAVAASENVPLVETRPIMKHAQPPAFSNTDLVHPTESGVQLIAAAVLDELIALDWIPKANLPREGRRDRARDAMPTAGAETPNR